MNTRSRVAVALAAALVCTPAILAAQTAAEKPAAKPAAAAAAKPEMPKAPAEMAQLKFFDGSWSCKGKMEASPMGPGGPTTTAVKSHTDMGGFWQSGMVKVTSSMGPFEGMFHMTYDTSAKQFMMLWVDSGGAWAKSSSSGWSGNDITFEGQTMMGGQTMGSRDVFTKNADGSMKHTMAMQMDGKWTPQGEETCSKAAAAKK